ncbi:MAG: Gfo/Idh/MocA family oxidoreductase [Alphaproteobacteria bacterium]|nr:MAG: Gfo/Idh/MocA family oxidoreductase [Alphaproteobacteria bacterium]
MSRMSEAMTMDPAASARRAPLKAAIIGMGKVGHTRARVIAERDDVVLVAAADVNTSAAAAYPGIRFETDFRGIVTDPEIDVVFVATTNKVAPDVVCLALQHGKHVFCEKPPGRSVADIERICAAEAANPGCKLQFGFNHRYHYAVLEAKSMVDSGVFGKILWARGVYGKMGGTDFENIWRSNPEEAGGGILLDQGIHMLDLFTHFMGDFSDIQSIVQTMHWDIPLEDNAFALLKTPANQVAMLHSSATQWRHKFNLELCLEEGYITLTGILSSTRSYGDETLVFARKDLDGRTGKPGNPQEEQMFFDKDHSWELEVAAFMDAVTKDQPVKWGNSADALRAMKLVFGIYGVGR